MLTTPTLVAGEESGGIAVAGHIPERDGIWVALVILEFIMAKTGKSLTQLIQDVYALIGAFKCDRYDFTSRRIPKSRLSSKHVSRIRFHLSVIIK